MRYVIKTFFFVLFVICAQSKLSAEITGSPHDFSGVAMTGSSGQICKVCHVPHNSRSSEAPLWRANLSLDRTSYTVYSSGTLDASVNQPAGPTKVCLTCHDGSVTRSAAIGCSACHQENSLGTDLSNDHPVSFVYDTALAQADGFLRDPDTATVPNLGGKTIHESMLYQGRMECSSCHDVHAKKGDSAAAPKLLLVNNNQNSLCVTCHSK